MSSAYHPPPDLPIKIKGSLKRAKKQSDVKAKLVAQLKQVNVPKNDPTVVKFVATYIENTVHRPGPEKRELLHAVLREAFSDYNDTDRAAVDSVLAFLVESGAVRAKPIRFFLHSCVRFLGRLCGLVAGP